MIEERRGLTVKQVLGTVTKMISVKNTSLCGWYTPHQSKIKRVAKCAKMPVDVGTCLVAVLRPKKSSSKRRRTGWAIVLSAWLKCWECSLSADLFIFSKLPHYSMHLFVEAVFHVHCHMDIHQHFGTKRAKKKSGQQRMDCVWI